MDDANRTRRMLWSGGAKVAARAVSLLVAFVSVPIVLGHLGALRYGAFTIGTAAVQWFMLAQLGVAGSLLTELARTHGTDASAARRLSATAFWLQVVLALLLAALAWWASSHLPVAELFGVDPALESEWGSAFLVLALIAALRLPMALSETIHDALQEGHRSSIWSVVGSLAALGCTAWVVSRGGGMAAIAAAMFAPQVATWGLSLMVLFAARHRDLAPAPWRVERETAGHLLRTGGSFVVAALAALMITTLDNLVIAHALGAAAVTPYAVTYLLPRLVLTVGMSVLDAAWPAYASAAARRDVEWIRRTHRRISRAAVLVSFLAGLLIAVWGPWLVTVWAGPEARPSRALACTFALMLIVQSVFLPVGRLVTALGAVQTTARSGLLNAAINLVASVLLVRHLGLPGVALGTILGHVAVGWYLFPKARRLLRELEPVT